VADRDVTIDIIGRDRTGDATRAAERGLRNLRNAGEDNKRTMRDDEKAMSRVAKAARTIALTAAKAAGTLSVMAGAGGAAAIALLAVGRAVAAVAKAAGGLTPLLATLPAIAAAVGLVKGTLLLVAPAFVKAFEPVTRAFFDADGNAGKLTERLRTLATAGVNKLAKEFVKVNLPSVAAGMERIARSTNVVARETLKWANTSEGQKTISMLTASTAASMERLTPKITAAAQAFGRLVGKAGDPAIKGLEDLIGRILDKFTAWANATSIDDIKQSLSDLSGYFDKLKNAWHAVIDVGNWLADNEGKVRAFSTAVAALGLAISIATGAWPAALIAGLALIVTNWDAVKSTLAPAAEWWSQTWSKISQDPAMTGLAEAVRGAVSEFIPVIKDLIGKAKEWLLPVMKEIGQVVMRDLIPAVSAFIKAAAPVAAWFTGIFGEGVLLAIQGVLTAFKGALQVISGVLNVFAGILSGDWSRVWKGIQQIGKGALDILRGIIIAGVSAIWGPMKAGFEVGTRIGQWFKDKFTGFFSDAGSWLSGAGSAIANGLANAISGAWGRVKDAVAGLVRRAKEAIPAQLRDAVGLTGQMGGWAPARAAAAFAAGPSLAFAGGGGRTGGATEVTLTNRIMLDGLPFAALTSKVVTESEKRSAWRAKVGRR
jgi:phage-related protein